MFQLIYLHRDQKRKLFLILSLEKEKVGVGRKAVEKKSLLDSGPAYSFVKIGLSTS